MQHGLLGRFCGCDKTVRNYRKAKKETVVGMGILHHVYQLKPKVITESAILCVKKDMEHAFLEKFHTDTSKSLNQCGILSNTFVENTPDGKVERHAMYSCDRIIDFKKPGIYLSVQSGSKYGFGSDFITGIKNIAPYITDSLFYVIWDEIIDRFEIKNGELTHQETRNFSEWDCNFENYVVSNYIKHPQIIADYYVDLIIELQLEYDDLVKHGDDPGKMYELEDYEELVAKFDSYKEYISIEEMKNSTDWLKEKIVLQQIFDDEYYGNS